MSTNPWAQVQGKKRRARNHAYQKRRAARRLLRWSRIANVPINPANRDTPLSWYLVRASQWRLRAIELFGYRQGSAMAVAAWDKAQEVKP